MAKFCGRCGHALDPKTGKCPKCDKRTAGNPRRRIGALLCLALVIAVGIGALLTRDKERDTPEPEQATALRDIIGPQTKTVYVVNQRKYSTSDYESTDTYEYDANGTPISHTFDSDFFGESSHIEGSDYAYVYAYDHENAMGDFSYITELDDDLTDAERVQREEEYMSRLCQVLESNKQPFDENTEYTIMCIDSEGRIWASIGPGLLLKYTDNNGMVLNYVVYADWGDIFGEWTYQYDDHGNRVSETLYRDFGPELSYKREYRYNGDQIVEYTEEAVSFATNTRATRNGYYSYDDAGRKIKHTIFKDDELEDYKIYAYDENGNMCRSESYNSDDICTSFSTYSYDKLTVPADAVESLTNIYKYLGITYLVAD